MSICVSKYKKNIPVSAMMTDGINIGLCNEGQFHGPVSAKKQTSLKKDELNIDS